MRRKSELRVSACELVFRVEVDSLSEFTLAFRGADEGGMRGAVAPPAAVTVGVTVEYAAVA